MKFFTKCLIVACVLSVSLFVVPGASADDWNRKTVVTFSAPVEVPGIGAQVLPAGTYVFKILDSMSDRHTSTRSSTKRETSCLPENFSASHASSAATRCA